MEYLKYFRKISQASETRRECVKVENWNEMSSRLQCWSLPIERRDWWTRSAHCKIATRERENCWNVTYLFHFHGRAITLVRHDKRVWCIMIFLKNHQQFALQQYILLPRKKKSTSFSRFYNFLLLFSSRILNLPVFTMVAK